MLYNSVIKQMNVTVDSQRTARMTFLIVTYWGCRKAGI